MDAFSWGQLGQRRWAAAGGRNSRKTKTERRDDVAVLAPTAAANAGIVT